MTIDRFGRIVWATTTADIGEYTVEVRAFDDRRGEAWDTCTLKVDKDTELPKASLRIRPNPAIVDREVTFLVSAVDNVGAQKVIVYAIGLDVISQTTTEYTDGVPGAPHTLVFGYDGHGRARLPASR